MQVSYQNSTKLYAVIGDPVAHSLSPLLHNTMAQELGEDMLYIASRVPRESLADWLTAVRTVPFAGFNATMPHKLDLMTMVDRLTPDAVYYGAVNTVKNENGTLIGHNTDGEGFALSLASHGLRFAGEKVAIFGAGGAAASIARKAVRDGAAEIHLFNRTMQHAAQIAQCAPQIRVHPLTDTLPEGIGLLINTLPVQVTEHTKFLAQTNRNCAVFDILYAPPKTPFLLEAERTGHLAVNGLEMLVYQAILAFSFLTGREIDAMAMGKRLLEAASCKL